MTRLAGSLTLVLLALLSASPASGQLLAAKDAPVAYGHHHVNATSADAHKKFWADTLGGTVITIGTNNLEVIRMTNVLIFMRAQAAKGGTKGSVHDHIGLSVPNIRATLDKVKANGYRVATQAESLPGQKVNGDIVELGTGAISALAYIFGPDDVKVEVMEMKAQAEPVKLHHVHFMGTQATQSEMRDWYIKVFGAVAAQGTPNFLTATLPGVGLNFSISPNTPVPTTGRVLDHIGFEVKNLQAFLTKLEGMGITPTVSYRKIDALNTAIAFVVDPWGTNIELTEGLDKVQ
jgi:catechol 2,3-dioxygenase-like lactoylglutathione lyase family enzyme